MSHPKKAQPFLDTRARSAVASTGPGLCVRFVPPALSATGLTEMRFVRHLLARRWVGRASRRASFQARRSLRPPDVSSFCESSGWKSNKCQDCALFGSELTKPLVLIRGAYAKMALLIDYFPSRLSSKRHYM